MLKWSVWLQDAALKGANSRKLKTPSRLWRTRGGEVSTGWAGYPPGKYPPAHGNKVRPVFGSGGGARRDSSPRGLELRDASKQKRPASRIYLFVRGNSGGNESSRRRVPVSSRTYVNPCVVIVANPNATLGSGSIVSSMVSLSFSFLFAF